MFLSLSLLSSLVMTNPTPESLSAEELLKGSKIPARREFPISKKISPCENFYDYVCAEVERSFDLPADRSYWTFSFNDQAERILLAQKNFFKKVDAGYRPSDSRSRQFVDFYLACMDKESSTNEERDFVQSELNRIRKIESKEDLKAFLEERAWSPDFNFVRLEFIPNLDNPDHYDVLVGAADYVLSDPAEYKNKQTISDLEALAKNFFRAIRYPHPEQTAKDVIRLERAFVENMPRPAEIRVLLTNRDYKSHQDFLKLYPELPFAQIFSHFPKNTQVRDFTPAGLQFWNEQINSGSLETLKAFLIFHQLKGVMDDAFLDFRKHYFNFQAKYLGGPKKRANRQERCTTQTRDHFQMEMDALLLPILFPQFPQSKVKELAADVRQSIINGIENNTWLSDQGKKGAIAKIKSATLSLVQPKNDKEWNFVLEQKYNSKRKILNERVYSVAELEKKKTELSTGRDRNAWTMGPLVMNAYYTPPDNAFFLTQAILQYPMFDPHQSDVENFGAIGMIIGHELGHGIDDRGSEYDERGRLKRWMSAEDLKEFTRRGSQFVARFNKIGHNGSLTLGENIGDHVGLSFSYAAAFSEPDRRTKENQKKFFESYAKAWCSVSRPEFDKFILKTDPHSLPWARVNEQVIHMDGFYEAFACSAADKMYVAPKDRIRIW